MRLETGADYRQRISLDVCGPLMAHIPPLVAGSLRMAIEGASVAQGRPPGWLERASDIRFVGYDHDGDDTLIALQLPRIGEAAEELYRQRDLWDTRPEPEDTAFEVFRRVVDEVSIENGESGWYDRQLLTKLSRIGRVLGREIVAIRLGRATTMNRRVADTAAQLGTITPASRQARVSGVLAMIRHSTRSFTLRLQDGEEVHGVMESTESVGLLREFFGKPVVVMGRAVYRPSGRLLRMDAAGIEDGRNAPTLFSTVPAASAEGPAVAGRLKVSETGKRGVSAFFGTWPGGETDAEMSALLDEIRGGMASSR